MKFKAMLLGLSVITALPAFAQKPVYLDTGKPIEERVKDALNRMTLEEKVKMIHAQSKFSSAGVPRLGIPEVWATDGPHGIRPEVLWDEWDQAGWTNDSCIAYPALTCLSATLPCSRWHSVTGRCCRLPIYAVRWCWWTFGQAGVVRVVRLSLG